MTSAHPEIKTDQPTKALTSQVGGHAGVLSSEDGSLIIKPCIQSEAQFYGHLANTPGYQHLLPYVPKFYGTLKLVGEAKPSAAGAGGVDLQGVVKDLVNKATGNAGAPSLVLQNLSHTFNKPNILDIKLGQVLYDSSANEDKKARMIKTAQATTSWESGVRLTGFQVYDPETDQFVDTPKTYGKSIKVADLPTGTAKFFPCSEEKREPPAEGEKPTPKGLPKSTLIPILEGVAQDLQKIKDAIAQTEMRMVGGSVLVIYEGDEQTAAAGLVSLKEARAKAQSEEDGDEDDDEDEDEDTTEETGKKAVDIPYLVKLIDFAHTHLEPGLGPDEGVLLGLQTAIGLVEGRLKEVQAIA